MFNHAFTLQMAEALAEHVVSETSVGGHKKQVERAFELTIGRKPESIERDAAESLVEMHGLRALCRALLNSSELIYLD